MSDITIQQTLKIVNGRVAPSVEPLDGDLVEVSKAPNNAIEVKEDGLYVPTTIVSEPTDVVGTGIIRNMAANGSYTESTGVLKTIHVSTEIVEDMVNMDTHRLKEPLSIDVSSYNFKEICSVQQKTTSSEGAVYGNITYLEDRVAGFVQSIKLPYLDYVLRPETSLEPVYFNDEPVTDFEVSPIVEGMQSISLHSTGIPITTVDINNVEVLRLNNDRYRDNHVLSHIFKAGDVIKVSSRNSDDSVINSTTKTVTKASISLNDDPVYVDTAITGTYTPNGTFTVKRYQGNTIKTIKADAQGHWTYTPISMKILNEYYLFYVDDVLERVLYVNKDNSVVSSVVTVVTLSGII